MCSRVSSWMLSLMFQFISTLVFHSILENQKCIGCFSLTNRAFIFFRYLNCFSPLLSLPLYFCFRTLPIMLCFFYGKGFIVGWRHQTLIFICPEKHFKLKLKCHVAVWIIMNPLILVLGMPLFSLTKRPQMWQHYIKICIFMIKTFLLGLIVSMMISTSCFIRRLKKN